MRSTVVQRWRRRALAPRAHRSTLAAGLAFALAVAAFGNRVAVGFLSPATKLPHSATRRQTVPTHFFEPPPAIGVRAAKKALERSKRDILPHLLIAPAAMLTLAAGAILKENSRVTPSDKFRAQAMGVFHLTKGIVGTGVLFLPAGVAAIASVVDADIALPFALCLMVLLSAVSAYSYREVARCAAATSSVSFAETFERSGAGDTNVAAMTSALNCFGGCIMYAMILGDTSLGLLHGAGIDEAIGAFLPVRFVAIAMVAMGVLWPACSKLDFRALEMTSVIGVMSSIVTTMVVCSRLTDASYTTAQGAFAASSAVAQAPVAHHEPFGAVGAILIFISMVANSFITHQSAPSLRKTVDQGTGEIGEDATTSFDAVVFFGFAISTAMYCVIMACGYLTFGEHVTGNVLDAYSADDTFASFAKLATTACVVCSFPQMLLGFRDSLRDLFGLSSETEESTWLTPPVLLALITVTASSFTDISALIAMQGAVLGSLIVFVMPAMMLGAQKQHSAQTEEQWQPHEALAGMGAVIGAGGTSMAVLNILSPLP